VPNVGRTESWHQRRTLPRRRSRRPRSDVDRLGRRGLHHPVQHAIDAHDQIDGSRLEILEGVGHFPHVESPERFAGVLLDFLAESEPGAGPEALGEVIAAESAARHASPASV
jgi:pimeloyl-ACP methyl ester carboxylesterase